jgi:hypothetical protein
MAISFGVAAPLGVVLLMVSVKAVKTVLANPVCSPWSE